MSRSSLSLTLLCGGILVVTLIVVYKMLSKRMNPVRKEIKNEHEISPENLANINADIEKLPECPDGVINFAYWLALWKILNLYSRRE